MEFQAIITASVSAGIVVGGIVVAVARTKFITKESCIKDQAICQKGIKSDIGSIKSDISKIKENRIDELKNLYQFIGEVRQYMKDDR